MPQRIVVVGGGAAGIGAAGAAKGTDPAAEIIVYTEYEDAAYSPCGIPYVHGGRSPTSSGCSSAPSSSTPTRASTSTTRPPSSAFDTRGQDRDGRRARPVPYDSLVVATGWNYGKPGRARAPTSPASTT